MTGIHQWIAVHLEPLVLGLAIALLVGVTLALVEIVDEKRRGRGMNRRPCKYSESVVLSPREPIRRRHNVGRSRPQPEPDPMAGKGSSRRPRFIPLAELDAAWTRT